MESITIVYTVMAMAVGWLIVLLLFRWFSNKIGLYLPDTLEFMLKFLGYPALLIYMVASVQYFGEIYDYLNYTVLPYISNIAVL